ncbi:DoxX family protein [Negadavirga shengliensis]|uniref:DoxX family protein n=1 Tax=Negadavirga shengliensis TaxID=1389218 RepID=A0ABV9SWX2_9BACT
MNPSLTALRTVLGIIFITHGAARIYHASVPDFGTFLESKNIPLGMLVAWIITLGEMVGGTLLILNKYVRYCVLFHAAVILGGIVWVHLPNGWFTVGHGSGGVEYSLLILAVLAFLYQHDREVKPSLFQR